MAITIAQDVTSSSGPTTGASPVTVSHTCTGSHRYLLVGIIVSSTNADVVTGVTYNGVAMSRINTEPVGTDTVRGYLYGLVNPASGTNNISVSYSGSQTLSTRNVSFTGANQSGQPDATNITNVNGSGTLSDTLTTVADNSVHYSLFFVDASAETAGSNTTAILGNGSNLYRHNPLIITPAGSNTNSVSWTGSQQVGVCGVSLSPSPDFVTSFTDAFTGMSDSSSFLRKIINTFTDLFSGFSDSVLAKLRGGLQSKSASETWTPENKS